MPLKHAIIEATVPNVGGLVSYTSPALSSWSTKGLALVFISGDTNDLGFGGFLSIGLLDHTGSQSCSALKSIDGSTGLPENNQADVNDHVGILLDDAGGLSWGSFARVAWSSSLANGVELNWTDVAGVGSRVFRIVIVLIEGFAEVAAQGNTSFSHGFNSHALLTIPNGNGSITAWEPSNRNANEVCPGLGGARNVGGLPQRAAYIVNDRNTDPLLSRGRRRTAAAFGASNGVSEFLAQVTAFNATSVSVTGTARGMHAAMRGPVGDGDFRIAQETLDGGTGPKLFTGLGARCNLIVGFVCGVTSDDTWEADSAALAPFAYFITDGQTTISLGFSQRHNGVAIAAGNPTDTYSSYQNGSIRMQDHLNGTAFLATVSELTSTGLNLQVSTGLSGTMMLFGFLTSPVVFYPDPVALGVAAPSPLVSTLIPVDPVELELVAPDPFLGFIKPTPVGLGLVAPPVVLDLPLPAMPGVEPTPPPPLGQYYARALLDLLPRGLAWTREESSTLGLLLRAYGEELGRVEFRGLDLVRESDVRGTHELLAEWEAWLRTREECPDLGATDVERRFALLTRLVTPGGQNAFHYSEVAQLLGYDVDVEDFEGFQEFKVGISEVGDALSNEAWVFVVLVHAPTVTPIFFRTGLSSAGEPLTTGGNERLICELDRIRPAHVLFLYAFDKPYTGYSPWNIIGPTPATVGLLAPIPLRL